MAITWWLPKLGRDCQWVTLCCGEIRYQKEEEEEKKLRGSTERPSFVGELNAYVCGWRAPRGQRDGSLWQYFRLSRPELLYSLSSSSSIVLTRLSGPRSRRTTSQEIW
jgi:hypothetical protein